MSTFKPRYKEKREAAKLTAQQAAVRLGVAISTISNWERGVSHPDALKLADMAELYGCSADELLGI